VTGRGSPIANLVVRDLIAYGAVTTTAAVQTAASTPSASPTSGPRMQRADIAGISLSTIDQTTSGTSSQFGFAGEQNGSAFSNHWGTKPMLTSSTAFAASSISSHVSDEILGASS